APVAAEHGHVANLQAHAIACACQACWLLFTSPGAAGGRYHSIPRDAVPLVDFPMDELLWAEMGIPVDMGFMLREHDWEKMSLFYPGPGGATESLLPVDLWDEVRRRNAAVDTVTADVEALLVRRVPQQGFYCWRVPIDRCYELVGRMRKGWRGF